VDGCSGTWWTHFSMLIILPEVKLGNGMDGEKHIPNSVGSCRPQCHFHAPEGLSYLEDAAKHRDPAFLVYTTYQVTRPVLQVRKGLREWSIAHFVLAGRGKEVKGLMGPLQVVDVPPVVEGLLAVGQVGEVTPLQDFSCNGPVKAFVLSLGLWARRVCHG